MQQNQCILLFVHLPSTCKLLKIYAYGDSCHGNIVYRCRDITVDKNAHGTIDLSRQLLY